MRRLIVFLICLGGLVACGGSPSPSSQAEAVATVIPTPHSLATVDLEPLLIQAGDLPAGVTGAQVRETPPEMFNAMPKAAKTINQQFAQGNKQVGGVTVFLYDAVTDRDAGYALILKGMSPLHIVRVGDDARSTLTEVADLKITDLAFRRCQAVAHIRMDGGEDNAIAYAQRLDKRLQSAVC